MKSQRKTALRLAIAEVAFAQAMSLTELLLLLHLRETHPIYAASVAGICVTYARPFLRGDGLGPLADDFKSLPRGEGLLDLQGMHDDLIELRHKVHAHRDLIASSGMLKEMSQPGDPSSITFDFQKTAFAVDTNEVLLPPQRLLSIRDLLQFQRQRLQIELTRLVLSLHGGQKPPPGRYKLTDKGFERI